jgi:hypothetical protein
MKNDSLGQPKCPKILALPHNYGYALHGLENTSLNPRMACQRFDVVEMGALSQKNHKKNAQKWPTRVQYVRRAF